MVGTSFPPFSSPPSPIDSPSSSSFTPTKLMSSPPNPKFTLPSPNVHPITTSTTNVTPTITSWQNKPESHPEIDRHLYLHSRNAFHLSSHPSTVEEYLAQIISLERQPEPNPFSSQLNKEEIGNKCHSLIKTFPELTRKQCLDFAIQSELAYGCPVTASQLITAQGIQGLKPDSMNSRLQSEIALAKDAPYVISALQLFLPQTWSPECQHPFKSSLASLTPLNLENEPSRASDVFKVKSDENSIPSLLNFPASASFNVPTPVPTPRTSSKNLPEHLAEMISVRHQPGTLPFRIPDASLDANEKANTATGDVEDVISHPSSFDKLFSPKSLEPRTISASASSASSSKTSSPFFDQSSDLSMDASSFTEKMKEGRTVSDDEIETASLSKRMIPSISSYSSPLEKKEGEDDDDLDNEDSIVTPKTGSEVRRFYGSSASPLAEPGLKGLVNLGNTCFMNSALQCISNTPNLILDYFVPGNYKCHINLTNPLGLKGEIAEAFAQLMKEIWTSGPSVVSPKYLRLALAKFAPQFRSFYQHDAQELLGFLLDGLHEDLNLVKNKPYVESNDLDNLNLSDVEKADRLWALHRARNDSIIVDYFQGQYKSTLKCLACSKQSVTFDPFMILTLPIPSRAKSSVTPLDFPLIVVPCATTPFQPFQVRFFCAAETTTPALLAAAYLPNAGDFRFISYQGNQVKHLFQSQETFKDIDASDDFSYLLYEVPSSSSFTSPSSLDPSMSVDFADPSSPFQPLNTENTFSSLLHFVFEQSVDLKSSSDVSRVGIPILISVPSSMTEKELYAHVMEKMLLWTPISLENLLETLKKQQGSLAEDSGDLTQWPLERFFQLTLSAPYAFSKVSFSSISTRSLSSFLATLPRSSVPSVMISSLASSSSPLSYHRCLMTWSAPVYQACFETQAIWRHLPSPYSPPSFALSPPPPHSPASSPFTLFNCFEQFSMLEQLTHPNDLVYCSRCQSHQAAEKKVDLFRLPPVLVIALKRFGSWDSYYRQKLTELVTFPFEMDLKDVASLSSCNYELYAVSNHYGSLGGGHYTAYVKNPLDRSWYEFDDTRVSRLSTSSQVQSEAAYVLFYHRVPFPAMPPVSPNVNSISYGPAQQFGSADSDALDEMGDKKKDPDLSSQWTSPNDSNKMAPIASIQLI